MGTMRGGMGMGMRAERSPHGRSARSEQADPPKKKTDFRKAMPEIWRLVRPRKWLLLLGLVLVAINRVAGLTLPFVARPLSTWCCRGSIRANADAAGGVSVCCHGDAGDHVVFTHAAACRRRRSGMIAELRQEVQRHVGRLSVAYYDENRTGTAGVAHHERR